MPKLVHIVADAAVREYPLSDPEFHIGRSPDNDLPVDDPTVSGQHARITLRPSPYLDGFNDVCLEDLGSTNGTQVNGRPVQRHLLKHGDLIRIGTQEFRYVDEQGAAAEGTRILLSDEPPD